MQPVNHWTTKTTGQSNDSLAVELVNVADVAKEDLFIGQDDAGYLGVVVGVVDLHQIALVGSKQLG